MVSEEDESREIAKAILEQLGGLEYINTFEFSRARDQKTKEDVPSIFRVHLCVFCHAPTWKSTEPGKENGWKIADFYFESALDFCDGCKHLLDLMSGPAAQLAHRQAVATTRIFGRILLKGGIQNDGQKRRR